MRAKLWIIGGALLGVTLLAGPGIGALSNPGKAKKYQSTLTAAYQPCTSPNTTTLGLGLPACTPVALADSLCSISSGGGGKLQAKADVADLLIKANLKGIQGCEGQHLCVVATVRVSEKNCVAGAECTVIDLPDFPLVGGAAPACCVVSDGKCKVKTTLNSALPLPVVAGGKNVSFEIGGCGLLRTTGTTPGMVSRCGVVVP